MSRSARAAVIAFCLGVATSGVRPPLGAEDAASPPDVGLHHHPITTTSAEAERYFDYGLTLVFAFNHDEAVRAFRRAAELDPKAAMPHWGIALALGPNINLDVDPERERAASAAVERAESLARRAPQQERDYIEALSRSRAHAGLRLQPRRGRAGLPARRRAGSEGGDAPLGHRARARPEHQPRRRS